MQLKRYLDLYALLRQDRSTKEERRAFGLSDAARGKDAAGQLSAWAEVHRTSLPRPLLSEQVEGMLYHATLLLGITALLLGIVTAAGLLNYSGKEPVNLVYFLAVAVLLPLVTMVLALTAMFRANRARNFLVHISPAYWLTRIIGFFDRKGSMNFNTIPLNPLILNWIIIRRSQLLALLFAVGMLLALLGVVATRDIAFAWSTTLQIDAAQFHAFIEALALPWRGWLPSAVPTLALVEQSHYFRLGGKLSETMVSHAAMLGAWWKFLAMATFVYAILLRFGMYLLAGWGLSRAIRRSLPVLDGADVLLRDMNEPLITTHPDEKNLSSNTLQESLYTRTDTKLASSYDGVVGWAIPEETLVSLCDAFALTASECMEAGGNRSLEEDRHTLERLGGTVLLFVKAWEPPTMDFADFLDGAARRASKVVVVPVGTPKEGYVADARHRAVWARKLASLDHSNVWMLR